MAVPYEGAPSIVPRNEPTPNIGVNAPPAAFGENIAEATGHLGQVIEGSGKELFDRAYAMQELQVHADVNARLADTQNQMMNHYVDYSGLEGKQAVDGLPAFQSKLDDIRVKGGEGLSPIGQELYDTESRNSRFRMGFAGATHAKDEQKRYVTGAAQAAMSSDMKSMELDPNNTAANDAALDRIRANADHISDIHGLPADDPARVLARNDAVNKAVQGQIRGMAQNDPMGADKLLKDAVAKKEIYGEEASRLGDYVKWQRDLHGSRVSAGQTMNQGAGFDLDNKKVSADQLLAGLKGSEGGNYNFIGPEVSDKAGNTGRALGHYGVMSYNLEPWLRESGIGPMSETDFLNNSQAQDQLAKFKMSQYQDKYGSAHAAAIAWFGGEGSVGSNLAKLRDKNMNGLEYLRNFDSGLARGSTLEQLTAAAAAHAETQFPGDSDFKDATTQKVIALHNQETAIQRDTDFNNNQTIAGALYGGIGPQKKIPTSLEELQLDPSVKQAWDQLQQQHPSELRSYLNVMASNAKGDVAMTPERLNTWQKLSGQAVQDPEGFMKATQDLSSLDLPRAQKLEIIRMQSAIYKKEDAAPQVSHALGVVNRLGMLEAAGITKDQDPDALHLFTGVLQDTMTQYQQDNGKPMPDDQIKSTAQQLLSSVPGKHWWNGSTQWFRSIDEVPDEAKDAISKEFQSHGIVPSEAAIMQTYLSQQYQEVYSKPAKSQVPRP